MSELADQLRTLFGREFVQEDSDEPLRIEPMPPLNPKQIADLQAKVGRPLPDDLVEALGICSGFSGPFADPIDFTGSLDGQELVDGASQVHHIALDGSGNSWCIDLSGHRESTSFIWFSCHDAPVVLVQSHSLLDFVREIVVLCDGDQVSKIDQVHEDELFEVWSSNPSLLTYAEAMTSSDPIVADFARQSLDPEFVVSDLRKAPVGMGFSWGRYGARTIVKRAGPERVFAYKRPPRSGIAKFLFGR